MNSSQREQILPNQSNRRAFLKTTIAASFAFPTHSSLFASTPSPRKETRPYQIGTCDWSLKTPLTTDSFHLAKSVGIEGMQYSFGLKGEGLDLRFRENRDAIRQTVKETDVAVTSLGMAILNKVPYSSDGESQQIVIDCIQTMATLKSEARELADHALASKVSPNIALMGFFGLGNINGRPDLIERVIEKFKRVAPLAEEHGVTLGIESLLNEADHRRILDSVGSPSLKVYYDTANSHKMGYDIYQEMESLGSANICQIHCKENRRLLGDGPIDFPRVKNILTAIDYQDWLIIEGSKPKDMTIEDAYTRNAAYLQSVFNG